MTDAKELRTRWDALMRQPCRHEARAVTYCETCWWQALTALCGGVAGGLEEPDDNGRCAVCARVLDERAGSGCLRGACSKNPLPTRFYALRRACVEYQEMVVDDGTQHRFLCAAES